MPAYVIFSNATLTDMAAKAPRTEAELLEVSGVGQVKADRYGRQFLTRLPATSSRTNKQARGFSQPEKPRAFYWNQIVMSYLKVR